MQRRIVASLTFVLLLNSGCADFSKDDIALLKRFGGIYIPSGEGPFAESSPVDAVIFDSRDHVLSDADFRSIFPVLARMDPHRLHFNGQHEIGDASVELINKLRSLRVLDVKGTKITNEGEDRLRVKPYSGLSSQPGK